ncbi:hypothetical protein N431DRAFT_356410 [Stipitochalara longipes BDJ]|nr:hypothetical protein N431DRAFT_356410 [Stipitochalara longipes BDJ]
MSGIFTPPEQPNQGPSGVRRPDPKDVTIPVPGWPALAQLISKNPELEAFPSFSDLAIKSLLYYQAELIYLRQQLHQEEYKDYYNGEGAQAHFADNLSVLFGVRDHAISENAEPPKQWILIEEIRNILEKYNATLLRLSKVSNFTKADDGNVYSLKECAARISGDGSYIVGDGALTWGSMETLGLPEQSLAARFWTLFTSLFISPDLERKHIAHVFHENLIFPRQGFARTDALTLWFHHSFIPLYADLRRKVILPLWDKFIDPLFSSSQLPFYRADRDIYFGGDVINRAGNVITTSYYSGLSILRMVFIVTTVVGCLLPTVAIIILAKINSRDLVLKLIAIFTAIFALGLILFSSSSSRDQIFLATIGFSAVMVVFVQNQVAPQ